MATPEKALFDLLYLGPGRSRLFASVPEMEFPRGFRWREVRRYVGGLTAAKSGHAGQIQGSNFQQRPAGR